LVTKLQKSQKSQFKPEGKLPTSAALAQTDYVNTKLINTVFQSPILATPVQTKWELCAGE